MVIDTLRRVRRRFLPAPPPAVVAFEHGRGSADVCGTTPGAIHDPLCGELGYEISGLDGDGPYGVDRFIEIFASGERVNFATRPRG